MSKYKLIMLRHGEGAWNKENRFCSWVDQKLNSDGLQEARNCGKQLKALNFEFDLVFTSILTHLEDVARALPGSPLAQSLSKAGLQTQWQEGDSPP